MTKIYFDITDIVHFAGRNNRLTGIQRVQFNIVNLLAQREGGAGVSCIFTRKHKFKYYEFDPGARSVDSEFDAESLITDLGLARTSKRFPGKVQIKSHLRQHAHSKPQRAWLKLKIYALALFAPQRLVQMDLAPSHGGVTKVNTNVVLKRIKRLPVDSHLVHLGSSWLFPETWRFAAIHRARGGDVMQYIYDLIPVTHPQFMPDKEPPVFIDWLKHAFTYASRFACISRWTAADLEQFASSDQRQSKKVSVVTLAHEFMGYARGAMPPLPERLADLQGRRFVLCVGTIETRKNGLALLRIWQQLHGELREQVPLLVFVGRYGKIGGKEFQDYLSSDGSLRSVVRVVDTPSDQTLAWLYRNCLFSVYPSVVEGWGLPVGESAWFGRYCVASQASSVPEVCGDLMGYVDPDDIDSIKRGVLQPLIEPSFLPERERAIAAAPLRTWQQVADELYDYIVAAK